MASNINLLRNSKVFYTKLTKAQALTATNIKPSNTWELQVMADFSFSQGTEQQTITLNEAGSTPARGQRSFNTSINPVDWNFGTYIRPYQVDGTGSAVTTGPTSVVLSTGTYGSANYVPAVVTAVTSITGLASKEAVGAIRPGDIVKSTRHADAYYIVDTATFTGAGPYEQTGFVATYIGTDTGKPGTTDAEDTQTFTRTERTTAPEMLLWNALVSSNQPFQGNYSTPSWTEAAKTATLGLGESNAHSFAKFGLIFKVDNTYYYIDDCALNQADINFGIDQIASIAWTGQGTTLTQLDNVNQTYSRAAGTGTLDAVVQANTWDSLAGFITNKLSTVTIHGWNIQGNASADQEYFLGLTGGQLTINNNNQFLTPELLGAVNSPIGYFSGTRAVSGNITCYLKVSTNPAAEKHAAELFNDLARHSISYPDNLFAMKIGVGDAGGQRYPQVVFEVPGAMLQIPSIDVQDVVSATINFTAQSTSDGAGYDGTNGATTYNISNKNELTVVYKSVA